MNIKINYPYLLLFALSAIVLLSFASCAFKSVSRHKNIVYVSADSNKDLAAQKLNVFAPGKNKTAKPVYIFLYGGNWNSGNRKLYSFFGNRLARKGIVSVIVDYPKSPKATYNDMAIDVATAVKWVKENITKYGGDSSKVFISGHSAGGHLAALVTVKKNYFDSLGLKDPIKGLILIDGAGLDMYGYLKEEDFEEGHTYLKTFTNDPAQWKASSPLYFLHNNLPPMLIYVGGKTYPSISESNEKFVKALPAFNAKFEYKILKGKKHVPMIFQFLNSYNKHYKEIVGFMNN